MCEVKRDWDLTHEDTDTVRQAFNYALESGARYVIITNGDYYAFYDRTHGLSYCAHFVGEFRLSRLRELDMPLIEALIKPNLLV